MTTTTTPPLPFTIRRATFHDLPALSRTSTLAFWNDVLFGRLIHPHRHTYPKDNDTYWLRRNQVYFWDWSHVFLVAVTHEPAPHPECVVKELPDDDADDNDNDDDAPASEKNALLPNRKRKGKAEGAKEKVIGTAHYSRIPSPSSTNLSASFDLAWYDPRRLLKPLFRIYWSLLLSLRIRTNRAADPARESIIEDSYSFLDHVWTPENYRAPAWYLECLAVRPEYQGLGVGRELVKWGMERAEEEGIAASVISAEGKERFYGNCGFDVGPVAWGGEGEGNPCKDVPGGLVFVREAKKIREGVVERESTRRRGLMFGGVEVEFV